jgi:hypothetical protein
MWLRRERVTIDSKTYRVAPDKKVDLSEWPTIVDPYCKSKKQYKELQGTTTTPFDMVVLNEMSRFHLALDALKHVPRLRQQAENAINFFNQELQRHHDYIREHLEDMPEIRNWQWTADFSDATAPAHWPRAIQRKQCSPIVNQQPNIIKAKAEVIFGKVFAAVVSVFRIPAHRGRY